MKKRFDEVLNLVFLSKPFAAAEMVKNQFVQSDVNMTDGVEHANRVSKLFPSYFCFMLTCVIMEGNNIIFIDDAGCFSTKSFMDTLQLLNF